MPSSECYGAAINSISEALDEAQATARNAGDITPPLNLNFVTLSSSIKLFGAPSEYLRPVQMLGYYPDEVLKR